MASTSHDKGVKSTQGVRKDKVTPCHKCYKKHGGLVCYKDIGACFNCGEHGRFVQDCPLAKTQQTRKPYGGIPRLKTQGRVFSMTSKDV